MTSKYSGIGAWPLAYGEDKFVIVFGWMHICNAVLDILGDLLVENGWTDALIQAHITSVGKADSYVKAAHITHTRHEHQVTACGLYLLLHLYYTILKQTIKKTHILILVNGAFRNVNNPILVYALNLQLQI